MVKRKMLAADEGLAEQVVKIAEERGQTLFSLVNEVLEQTVRAHDMGLPLKQIVDERGLVEAAREAGFVLVVKTLWFDVLDRAFKQGVKRSMLEKWRETGRWYGKFFAAKKPQNPVEGFRDAVCNLVWGASEFDIEVNDGEGEVCCISAEFPLSYTELFSAFLGGALEALGYRCTEKDVSKGVIRLRFKVEGEGG
ncbi:MAG: hypothetical protein QME50_04010 [Candidatus Bathyarchaeota archaeon]|nr:hypothetical protein [Candidatus Bathyarchaeota archaeon]